ncbi:hypothetical protein FRC07_014033, partial [Ceratobasidium sp. 392]
MDGIDIERSESGNIQWIYLASSLAYDTAFGRFDIYAPFVKSLDIYGPSNDFFNTTGWWPLVLRNRQQTLFPKLHTLSIKTSCNPHEHIQLGMWIQALASPSLVNFLVLPIRTDKGPIVSYPMAAFMLKSAQKLCPNLKSLSLFPDSNEGDIGFDGESPFLMLLAEEPFYSYLPGLHDLRSFSSSIAWFGEEALGVLSRMPNLERLVIYDWHDKWPGGPWSDERLDIKEDSLSEEAFPCLRLLSLNLLHPEDVSAILMTKGLVCQLTTLDLHSGWNKLDQAAKKQEWLLQKVIRPLQNIKSLNKLLIKVDGSLEDVVEMDEEALAVFSQLPLVHVHLSGIRISAGCLDYTLGAAWPNLIRLQMPMQRVTLS